MVAAAAIVTGVVGAPIARADIGPDLGAPPQAGIAVGAALAAAPSVPFSSLSEEPVPPATPLPPSTPPTSTTPEVALQAVMPDEGTAPVLPSQAELPPASLPASTSSSSASPADPSAQAASAVESPVAGAPEGDPAAAPPPPPGGAPGSESRSDITAAEPTAGEQKQAQGPTTATQLGPVNIQVSIRVASPGDNGTVTQVNAVLTGAPGSADPAGAPAGATLDDHPDYADTAGSPGQSRDIGRDIAGSAINGSTDDSIQRQACDPKNSCCPISVLADVCLNTDATDVSPQDIVRVLNAILGNASGNAGANAQYQDAAVQYRPVNISVSIRISSPGNDGPVAQANLVRIQASVSVGVGTAVQPLPAPLDPLIGLALDGEVTPQESFGANSESGPDTTAQVDIEAPTTTSLGPTLLDAPFPLSSGPVSPSWMAISPLARGVGPSHVARVDHLEHRASHEHGQRHHHRAGDP